MTNNRIPEPIYCEKCTEQNDRYRRQGRRAKTSCDNCPKNVYQKMRDEMEAAQLKERRIKLEEEMIKKQNQDMMKQITQLEFDAFEKKPTIKTCITCKVDKTLLSFGFGASYSDECLNCTKAKKMRAKNPDGSYMNVPDPESLKQAEEFRLYLQNRNKKYEDATHENPYVEFSETEDFLRICVDKYQLSEFIDEGDIVFYINNDNILEAIEIFNFSNINIHILQKRFVWEYIPQNWKDIIQTFLNSRL